VAMDVEYDILCQVCVNWCNICSNIYKNDTMFWLQQFHFNRHHIL